MKAIQIKNYGEPEELILMDAPTPEPGPGEVLVRLEYAGVNFIDIYTRKGVYKKSQTYKNVLPFTIGREGAGVVHALGAGVTGFAPGDRVAYCLILGSYAQYATVPASRLVKVPNDIELDIATTLMLQGCTAHYLSHSLFALGPDHACLVHAGAGGVGQLLIQLAKARGARVFATVGNAEKAGIATARGADHVIQYREEAFDDVVLEATGGVGVDVVYDSVGQATFQGSLRSLKRRGMCALFGGASGAVESVEPLALAEAGSLFLTRPHMADYMSSAGEINSRADALFELVRQNKLIVSIDREFALADADQAHRVMEARGTTGKLLLKIQHLS